MFDKIIGSATGSFHKVTMLELYMCIVYVIGGLIVSMVSADKVGAISVITAIMILLNGGVTIFSYFKCDQINFFNANLIYGIIIVVLGIISFFAKSFLAIVLGLFLIAVCLKNISYAIDLFKNNESSWLLTLVVGILYTILGIILFFTSHDSVANVACITLIGYGIMDAVNIVLFRKRSMNFVR